MKKVQEQPSDLANEALSGAFTLLEDVMLEDVRQMERMVNDIRVLQTKLKKLVFKFSDGETSVETNTDARIGFDFQKKTIFYKANDMAPKMSLVSASSNAKKEVYSYLPKLITELKEEYVFRKELASAS